MAKHEALFERTSIERIWEQAKNARSTFLKQNSIAVLAPAGASMVAVAMVVGIILEPAVGRQQILEATIRMERLAARLGHVQTVPPETARQVNQLMHRPQYDCDKAVCTADLNRRNRSARAQLQDVLARNAPPEMEPQEVAASDLTLINRTRAGTK